MKEIFWNSSIRNAFLGKFVLFIKRGIYASNCKFSNKNDLLYAWRDFHKTFCVTSSYPKWMFSLQISSIFNFYWTHESWNSGVLGVKDKYKIFWDFLTFNQGEGALGYYHHLITFIILRIIWFFIGTFDMLAIHFLQGMFFQESAKMTPDKLPW